MPKLLAVLVLSVCLYAQTHTEVTVEDAQTVSGNKTFSGTNTHSGVETFTTAQFKGTPWFDVKAYGALCDGATDDTTAIQAAVTAATAVSGEIHLPLGTCITGALTGASNIHIKGEGKYLSILKLKASANADLLTFDTKVNWQLSDLTLDGNRTNQSATSNVLKIINTTGSDPKYQLARLYIINGHDDGINFTDSSHGAGMLSDISVYFNDGFGIRAGAYDNKWNNVDVGQSGLGGIYITASNQVFSNTKSWFSGRVTPAVGYGFNNETAISTTTCINCIAEDNQSSGFFLKGTNLLFSNAFAHSNSQSGSAAADGFFLSSLTNSIITGSATATGDLSIFQRYGVNFSSATNNVVSLATTANVTAPVGGTPSGNQVNVVNSDGTTTSYHMGTNIQFGSSAATSGIIGIPNNSTISGRNNANSANIAIVKVRTDDCVEFGATYLVACGSTIAPGSAASKTLGTTSLPYSQLFMGTAATNNFNFVPAATSAGRTVNIADPGATSNMRLEISGTATVDLASVASAACSADSSDVTVTGAAVGDTALVTAATALEAGGFLIGRVTASNTARFQFCNLSAGAIDRASDTYKIRVLK